MQKTRLWMAALVGIFGLLACRPSAPRVETKVQKKRSDSLSAAEINQLQSGDILLRKGFGFVSERIVRMLPEAYGVSHAGIVWRVGDSVQVIHIVSDNKDKDLRREPLYVYTQHSQAASLLAVRPRLTAEEHARFLGESLRFLAKDVRFDLEFDSADSSKLYCSEFVRDALRNACGRDLLPELYPVGRFSVIRMRNFWDARHFEVLFNHCAGEQ